LRFFSGNFPSPWQALFSSSSISRVGISKF